MTKKVRYYWNQIKKEKRSCVRCGFREFRCSLVIHHKDCNSKHEGIKNLVVLCANCHTALHSGLWKLEDIGIETPEIIIPDKSNWHRPEVLVNWKKYDELRAIGVPARRIAKELGVSHSKLYNALKERARGNGQ